ncbi:MAG: LCP family protein [Chloroflexi bacterium]|nr:LCP family protein [Chloroflexota bacterium]
MYYSKVFGVLFLGLIVTACAPSSTPIPPSTPTNVIVAATLPSATALPSQTPFPTTTVAPSETVMPTAVSTPTIVPPTIMPTPTAVVVEESLFDALVKPLVSEALKRRAERLKTDPDFAKAYDAKLNEGRVNFLLFGYGETHEPPVTERAIIGSDTIISYDLRTHQADIVSFTHDIRAPEIERVSWKQGQINWAVRIDQAYNVGGFPLMRKTLRNATGLAIDYQVVFRDAVMVDLIDSVFEGIEIDVPAEFAVQPFYLDGKKYDKGFFPKGLQKMDGKRVLQFIKTVPITDGYYGKSLEHNVRKHLMLQSLLGKLKTKQGDPKFWLSISAFVTKQLITGGVAYDFDPVPLVVNNLRETASSVGKLTQSTSHEIRMPTIRRSIYVVDPAHGEGGVRWVEGDALENPIAKKDIETGVYPHLAYEVPSGANPYGDLVTEYWGPVRSLVKSTLDPTYVTPMVQPQ